MTGPAPLVDRTVAAFRQSFGGDPLVVAFAPGRVNLIGDHTDYNDGFALPCALQVGTVVAIAPLDDDSVIARAIDLDGAADSFRIDQPIPLLSAGQWQNHVRGIAAGVAQFGLPLRGARLVISGDIPQGNGLSSSASLGVALALGLAALGGELAPDRQTLARIAQWAEHNYVGCACGIMDQIASAYGQPDCAVLLDCRNLEVQPVAFPGDAAIMVVPSGVARGLVDSAYNERRAQCTLAAEHYGVSALRDLDVEMLEAARHGCDEIVYRRARHVVTENARTLQAANAIEHGDLFTLGDAMRASHASLKADFEVSVPAVDALVDCLNDVIGSEGGARMTGGGFGGCVVAVVPKTRMTVINRALSGHWERTGIPPQQVLLARPSPGATLIAV